MCEGHWGRALGFLAKTEDEPQLSNVLLGNVCNFDHGSFGYVLLFEGAAETETKRNMTICLPETRRHQLEKGI